MKMELRKNYQFEAAHMLSRLPRQHKCRRLHGHSFRVEIAIAGECDPKLGWVLDYGDISRAFQPGLEHRRVDLEEAQAPAAALKRGDGG